MADELFHNPSPKESEELRARIQELEHRLFEQTADAAILARLKLDEARYRAIVEDQSELIVRNTIDGVRTFVNEAYCRFAGRPREELIGKNFLQMVLPDDREKLRRKFDSLTVENPWAIDEHRGYAPDGSIVWQEWIDRALFDENGKLIEIQSVGRDITRRKEAEEKLRHLEVQLAHVARLSTMGELVAGIAHEVNQPLYAILNFSKACRNLLAASSKHDLDLLREWTDEIASAASRAGVIIKRLSDFVRNKEVERKPDDINAIVRETTDFMGFEARRHQVHVELELTKPLPPVRVDRVQIQQVIVNLLKNAFEAVDTQEPTRRRVRIRTVQNHQFVQVLVQDTGHGIKAGPHFRLFEPFNTTKPQGMGMGLAIARGIAESHGGKLEAANRPEGGAQFVISLPYSNDPSSSDNTNIAK